MQGHIRDLPIGQWGIADGGSVEMRPRSSRKFAIGFASVAVGVFGTAGPEKFFKFHRNRLFTMHRPGTPAQPRSLCVVL